MAVIHTSWTEAAQTNWLQQSGDWVATDPAYKVDAQLNAWITALNDPLISVLRTPNDSTSRGSTAVWWLIQTNTGVAGEDPYGFVFRQRRADYIGSNIYAWNFFGWYDNGGPYGSFQQQLSSNVYDSGLDYPSTHDIFYEGSGATPWFLYSHLVDSGSSQTVYFHYISKLDASGINSDSYYPASGYAPWLYTKWSYSTTSTPFSYLKLCTSAVDNNLPKKGACSGVDWYFPLPSESLVVFPFYGHLFGHTHYLGVPSNEIMMSRTGQGSYGDTAFFGGREYMYLGQLWAPLG